MESNGAVALTCGSLFAVLRSHGMTKFGEASCVVCGRSFGKKHPAHKYCHWQCQSAANKARRAEDAISAEALLEGRKADVDVMSFENQPSPNDQAPYQQDVCEKTIKLPKGRYVYAWFNNESLLPFYIGKGVDDRAWRRHVHKDDGRSQLCQQIRASSSGFEVKIIRENMTNEGAMLVESALISFVLACGGFLSNQVDPLCRKERPPLELTVAETE